MEITESLARRRANLSQEKSSEVAPAAQWLATGFGLGRLPLAPGTWGALAAMIFLAVLYSFPGEIPRWIHGGLTLVLIPLGWYSATLTSRTRKNKDPNDVVIDEIAGQLFCFLIYPPSTATLMIGFLLFRLFDIVKPFPVRHSERFYTGLGIMLDDLIAGLYAGLALWIGYALFA